MNKKDANWYFETKNFNWRIEDIEKAFNRMKNTTHFARCKNVIPEFVILEEAITNFCKLWNLYYNKVQK